MAREFTDYNVEELQGYYSDFHKDFYGHRPRSYATAEQWANREYLIREIDTIHARFERLKSTFEGREFLREQGWLIEEEDPQLILRAAVLKDERDAEYEKWLDSVTE